MSTWLLDSWSPSTSRSIASCSSSFIGSGAEGESDDTIILQPSPAQTNRDERTRLSQVSFTDWDQDGKSSKEGQDRNGHFQLVHIIVSVDKLVLSDYPVF